MIKKIGAKGILSILLILSLLVNLSYLKASEAKYRYTEETISQLHEEFSSALHTLYMNLYQIKDSDFKDKEYINSELDEAISKIHSYDKMMYQLGYLNDEFKYYHHYSDVYMYLIDLKQKDKIVEEDLQNIKEIYSLAVRGSKGITARRFLYKLTPTEAYNDMSMKISEICSRTR